MNQSSLTEYLTHCGRIYDVDRRMLATTPMGTGYHSTLAPDSQVHPVRESLNYALGLLQSGGLDHIARASDILRRTLPLQDADPLSATYGVWPWYLEEPLDQMNPPDWNWADFCGARIAQMLRESETHLDHDLAQLMRGALGHAAWSIFRRNVQLDYTNIAIMGAGVVAAAGEILEEHRLTDFGRERLRRTIEMVEYHGSLPEYNSPTYTLVALQELERILYLVRDPQVRDYAEKLRQITWKIIAEHYHPGTQQWAGPHSRAYADHLRPPAAAYLSEQAGIAIAPHPCVLERDAQLSPISGLTLVPALPCPESLRERFVRLPESSFEIQRRFVKLAASSKRRPQAALCSFGDRCGTTWFCADATLGSISHEDLWTQRRAVIGYLRTDEDPAVTLRLRFLHDGRDFASAFVCCSQRGPRVLSAISFVTNRGDWHPYFDHPPDDLFQAEDFRVRYELKGKGVRAEQIDHDRFALSAGSYRAVIHTAAGTFGSNDLHYECGQQAGSVFVDGICYHGPRKGFNLASINPAKIAIGLELLLAADLATTERIEMTQPDENTLAMKWGELSVTSPVRAHIYPE